MSEPINSYPRSGPIRGLLVRLADRHFPPSGRVLVSAIGHRSTRGGRGTCRWCGQPCATRREWHDPCVRAYLTAKGATRFAGTDVALIYETSRAGWDVRLANNRWYAENGKTPEAWASRPHKVLCDECGEAGYAEIDHELALSVACELAHLGERHWWRAWTVANLRPLCQPCHAVKTRHDRARLARLRAGTPDLFERDAGRLEACE